jgi:hypothetical protein
MTKGRHAASVNAALRSDLAAAVDRADRADRIVVELRRQLDAAGQRIEEITAENHPAVVAERARADAAMRRDDAKKAADEVEQWWMTNMTAIRHTMKAWIARGCREEEDFIDVPFIRVMHHVYGDDLAAWFADSGTPHGKTRREERRDWLHVFKVVESGAVFGRAAVKRLKMDKDLALLVGMQMDFDK